MNVAHVSISGATSNRVRFRAASLGRNMEKVILEEDIPIACWAMLSQAVLTRDWDNDDDAIYDNWREIYGVPAR